MKKNIIISIILLCSPIVLFAWGSKRGSTYQMVQQQDGRKLAIEWAKKFGITNDSEKKFLQAVGAEDEQMVTNYLPNIKNSQALLAGAKIAAELNNTTLQSKISAALTQRFKARS